MDTKPGPTSATTSETGAFSFEGFRLDAVERLLERDGKVVPLTPKAFDLLVYLVERAGRLVEKPALISALWPDAIVEEANLAFQVSALRKALDASSSGEPLIQTVPTKGYRFVATVTRESAHQEPSNLHRSQPSIPRDADGARTRKTIGSGRAAWISICVGLLLVLALAIGYRLGGVKPSTTGSSGVASGTRPRVVPVTTLTGWQDWPSLSPDGTQVAFEWAGEVDDNPDIYVTVIGTTDVRRLTSNPAMDYAPSWSPDGSQIAFLRLDHGTTRIHLMSVLGGADRVVSDFPAYGKISWSPDGRYIVAGIVGTAQPPKRGIYLVPASGGTPGAIVRVEPPAEVHAPAFSPDGRRLAYVRCDLIHTVALTLPSPLRLEQHGASCDVHVIEVNDVYAAQGAPQRLTRTRMTPMGTLAWSRDGRSVVFWGAASPTDSTSDASSDHMDHLWRVAADRSGNLERLEIAGFNARRPATTAARERLVFSRSEQDSDIFRLTPGQAPQRVVTSAFLDGHASFSPDGRYIAFSSNRTGATEIWVAQADGSSPRRLTRDPTRFQASPSWSPDGKTIAFDAEEADGGSQHIWAIAVEGGGLRRLTSGTGRHSVPTWSHDGRWIYYTAGTTERHDVWRIQAAGGRPEQMTRHGSGVVAYESADGQHIIYRQGDNDTSLLESTIGDDDQRVLISCVAAWFGFSVVGDDVYYEPCGERDTGAIRVLDRRTGRDRLWGVVPNAKNIHLWSPAISPDGRTVLFDREVNLRANLWLVEDFR